MAITDPRDIPGLVVWYSAEAETGFADGAVMPAWTDLSGNGNHATAGVTGNGGLTKRPQWGATTGPSGGPAVRFPDINNSGYFSLPDILSAATSGEILLQVRSQSSATGGLPLWGFGASTAGADLSQYPFTDGKVYDAWGLTAGQRQSYTPSLSIDAWRRLDVWAAANDWAESLDGVTQSSRASATVGFRSNPMLGHGASAAAGTSTFRGWISAVVIYNRKLTSAERADLDAWLVANPSGGTTAPPGPTGTASGSFTFTGTATGEQQPGTAAGSFTFTGTATGDMPGAVPSGAASGSFLFTGSAEGQGPVVETLTPDFRDLDASARNRHGEAQLILEPAVMPEPPGAKAIHHRTRAVELPAPVVTNGVVTPMNPVLHDAEWGRIRVRGQDRDLTWFRDVMVEIPQYQLTDPYSYGPATMRVPSVHSYEIDNFGTGDLDWLPASDGSNAGYSIDIERVKPDGMVASPPLWSGHIDSVEFDDKGRALLLMSGELSGRLAKMQKNPPIVRHELDLGNIALGLTIIRPRHFRRASFWGGRTGITLVNNIGAGGDRLTAMDAALPLGLESDGSQWTLMATGRRLFDLVKRDTSVQAEVYLGADGVSDRLRSDAMERPNVFYGSGVAPNGQRWDGSRFPEIGRETPPPWPMPGQTSFGVGTTDADTLDGSGISTIKHELLKSNRLELADFNDTYDAAMATAVRGIQRDANLPVTGVINEATFGKIFRAQYEEWSFAGAKQYPLFIAPHVEPYLYSANGSRIGANPKFDPTAARVERAIAFPAGWTQKQAERWCEGEYNRLQGASWVGSVSLDSDAFDLLGNPIHRLDLEPGPKLRLRRFDGGIEAHVSSITVTNVTSPKPVVSMDVDTHGRDAAAVRQIIKRIGEKRNPARRSDGLARKSRVVQDTMTGWSKVSGIFPEQLLRAYTWNMVKVIGGQSGTIDEFFIRLINDPAAFAMLVTSLEPNIDHLNHLVPHPIGIPAEDGTLVNPGFYGDDPSEPWTDGPVQDLMERKGGLYLAGTYENPLGYKPKKKTHPNGNPTGHPITGKHHDDAGWTYQTQSFREPWLYVMIWPDRDCRIAPAGPDCRMYVVLDENT